METKELTQPIKTFLFTWIFYPSSLSFPAGHIQSSQFHFGVARANGCSATYSLPPFLLHGSFIQGNSKEDSRNTQWGKCRPMELCALVNGAPKRRKTNHFLQNLLERSNSCPRLSVHIVDERYVNTTVIVGCCDSGYWDKVSCDRIMVHFYPTFSKCLTATVYAGKLELGEPKLMISIPKELLKGRRKLWRCVPAHRPPFYRVNCPSKRGQRLREHGFSSRNHIHFDSKVLQTRERLLLLSPSMSATLHAQRKI